MKITEIQNTRTEFCAKVIIPVSEMEDAIRKEFQFISQTAKMDGFRAGKVPDKILKKKYYSSIRADIIKNKINSTIKQVIKNNNLNIATNPEIQNLNDEDTKDLEFILKFELLPDVILPDFKTISVEKPILEVTEHDINQQISSLLEMSTTYIQDVSGQEATKGNQLIIDAIGYVDGKEFVGGKLNKTKIVLGSNTFIPGFEDQLLGKKSGDNTTIRVTFPIEYHTKVLAGKLAEFKVKIQGVYQAKIPKIDHEFAKKFQCDTVDELKEKIRKSFTTSYEEPIYLLMKKDFFDKLEKILTFDVPDSLIKKEKHILEKQQSLFADTTLHTDSTELKVEYTQFLTKIALRRVRIGLIIAEYSKQKNIQITEEDVRQMIIKQTTNYSGKDKKQFIEFYQKDRQALEELRGHIIEEKGIKSIFSDQITLVPKIYSKDNLDLLIEGQSSSIRN